MKYFALLLFLLISLPSFAISPEEILGTWYLAEGPVSEVSEEYSVTFEETEVVTSPTKETLAYAWIDSSRLGVEDERSYEQIWYLTLTEKVLTLVEEGSKDTLFFMRKEDLYPSKSSISNKKFLGEWRIFDSWDSDTVTFRKDGTAVGKVRSKKIAQGVLKGDSVISYRILDEHYIEFVYDEMVEIAWYRIENDYMEIEAPFIRGKSTALKLREKPEKFSKKYAKKILGDWEGESGTITFSSKGEVLFDDSVVTTYHPYSPRVMRIGNEYLWIDVTPHYLKLAESTVNNTGDVEIYLRPEKCASGDELRKTLSGEWEMRPVDKGDMDDVKTQARFTEDSLFIYRDGVQARSSSYTLYENRLSTSRHDTVGVPVVIVKDTVITARQIVYIRCREPFEKKPHEKIIKESFSELELYRSYPTDSLVAWFGKEQSDVEIEKSEWVVTVALEDMVTLKEFMASDSGKSSLDGKMLIFGKPKEMGRYSEERCEVVLVDSTIALSGTLVSQIRVAFEFQRYGDHAVEVTLNEEGRKAFEELTRKSVKQQLAVSVNGVLVSNPTVMEPIPDGIFQISFEPEEESTWQEAFDVLKQWGK